MSSLLGQTIPPMVNLYNVKESLVWPSRKFITMFVYYTVCLLHCKSKVWCKNSVTLKHFQKCPNNQGVILALSPSISLIGWPDSLHIACFWRMPTTIYMWKDLTVDHIITKFVCPCALRLTEFLTFSLLANAHHH